MLRNAGMQPLRYKLGFCGIELPGTSRCRLIPSVTKIQR